MEILILGIVLLVLGIGSTMVYDNMKANGKSLSDYLPKVNQNNQELKAFAKTQSKVNKPANTSSLDELMNEIRASQRNRQYTQAKSVQELIAKIESMKKNR